MGWHEPLPTFRILTTRNADSQTCTKQDKNDLTSIAPPNTADSLTHAAHGNVETNYMFRLNEAIFN